MHLLRTTAFSMWWACAIASIVLAIAESQHTTKKCEYYRLTMYMDCNNLNLGEIHPNTYPVNESRIKDLLLHHNSLRRLEHDVFYNLPNLLTLDLSDNFLSTLDYRLFVKTPELKTLNFKNNRLTILGDGRLFQMQTKLISLLLDYNRLKYINESVLSPLVSLKTLLLFGNSFVCNCELKKTMLWCESKKIETSALCDSPLKYSNSSWTILNKEDCNKTENVTTPEILDSRCNYDIAMRSLDCRNVPLRSIRMNNFPSNLSLDILVLQDTSISTLEYDVFSSLSSLKLLDLSNNFLENLDHLTFSKLDHLITLNLSYNKLLSLPEDLFKSQKQLKILELNNNHFTHLAEETLAPLASLEHLNLSENRFICDCELSEAMVWCEERNLSTGATCAFPRQISGSSWTVLRNNTDCAWPTTETYFTMSPLIPLHDSEFNIILLVSVIGIAILFLVSVLVALWYFCKRRGKEDDGMIYDDICLEERNVNDYDVLEEKREKYSDNVNIHKSIISDDYGAMNAVGENPYEDIELLRNINKQCTSNEVPKHSSDSKDSKPEKSTGVLSYIDISNATNKPRKENPYILK